VVSCSKEFLFLLHRSSRHTLSVLGWYCCCSFSAVLWFRRQWLLLLRIVSYVTSQRRGLLPPSSGMKTETSDIRWWIFTRLKVFISQLKLFFNCTHFICEKMDYTRVHISRCKLMHKMRELGVFCRKIFLCVIIPPGVRIAVQKNIKAVSDGK
jgi:hypothetical protein